MSLFHSSLLPHFTPGFFFRRRGRRHRHHEIDAARHPLLQSALGSVALGSDAHEARHDAPAHFHRLNVRFTKHQLMRVRTDADQKAAPSTDGTAHAAFHHEAKTAHKLLFDDVWPDRQKFAHPSSRLFVVCHQRTIRDELTGFPRGDRSWSANQRQYCFADRVRQCPSDAP